MVKLIISIFKEFKVSTEQILETIATEMRLQAKENPISVEKMLAGIASLKFPENLRRVESVGEFGVVAIQFSHDQIGSGKHIEHLSFSRKDLNEPTPEMTKAFQTAFFGSNNYVINLPSTLSYVIQLAKIAES